LSAASSVSTNATVVRALPWSVAARNDGKAYFGLQAFVFVRGDTTRSTSWESANCGALVEKFYDPHDDDLLVCHECRDASLSTVSFAILAFVTSLPNLKADLTRSTRRGDTNCIKAFNLLANVVSFGSHAASITIYSVACHNAVGAASIGAGLVCATVALALKPAHVAMHALLRTPLERHRISSRRDGASETGVYVVSTTGPALL
jgi:hypothetical protein